MRDTGSRGDHQINVVAFIESIWTKQKCAYIGAADNSWLGAATKAVRCTFYLQMTDTDVITIETETHVAFLNFIRINNDVKGAEVGKFNITYIL